MDSSPPCVSFIGIVDFSEQARWLYMTESVSDLLGYEPSELIGRPSLELVHPDEFARVKMMHYETITKDKAAVLAYLRMKHKDPYKGYILCGISRTVVHNVLAGSVSFATPGPKAMHNASTAQEIEVVTPSAVDFQLRRWNDPSPMPSSPTSTIRTLSPEPSDSQLPSSDTSSGAESSSSRTRSRARSKSRSQSKPRSQPPSQTSSPEAPADFTFEHLPSQSLRTALILDRFTLNCTVLYCANDNILSTTDVLGRSFFDFVDPKDDGVVRSWIEVVKGWGVNERGQPSDGGFGFGKFTLCKKGRDSSAFLLEPTPSRRRNTSQASASTMGGPSRSDGRVDRQSRPRNTRKDRSAKSVERPCKVDSIFSAHSDGVLVILRYSGS